jgi:pyruvate kinase
MIRKQTKIVATVSDRRSDKAFLQELYENGVNVFRLNTAHQQPEETIKVVQTIRSISDELAVLVDTKGPEVRTAESEKNIGLTTGEYVDILPLSGEYSGTNKELRVTYDRFVEEVPEGAQILIDDGEIALSVEGKSSGSLTCRALNDGEIGGKKSVNTPGIHLDMPSLTEKDREYIRFCKEEAVDFIAHSFVRTPKDVTDIKSLLGERNDYTKIIAKIENQEGVDNLEAILAEAYGIMVARGDLAIEIPSYEVPVIQKRMVAECINRAQPVITATQMLHSMIQNPRPTRAEINDVANAVFDGSDAVMLSGETAYGAYPVESVKIMTQIIQNVEAKKPPYYKEKPTEWRNPVQRYLANTAHKAEEILPIKAIITLTQWGSTARLVSSYRPGIPIYAKCTREHTKRLLALQYGIYPSYVEKSEQPSETIYESLSELLEEGLMMEDDLVLILGTDSKKSLAADRIEIKSIRSLIYEKRNQFDYTKIFTDM